MSLLWWHNIESIGAGLAVTVFFAFVIGHAAADFPLQSEFMARGKNRHLPPVCPETTLPGLWIYCLTAHAMTHGGFVWIISGCPILAAVEVVMHWLIDFLKMERKINFHVDQTLHLLCKAAYVAILLR